MDQILKTHAEGQSKKFWRHSPDWLLRKSLVPDGVTDSAEKRMGWLVAGVESLGGR